MWGMRVIKYVKLTSDENDFAKIQPTDRAVVLKKIAALLEKHAPEFVKGQVSVFHNLPL